jgi:hypothetical protein
MDINELLRREQISLANAATSACTPSRIAHEGLARAYGTRLIAAGFPHRPYPKTSPAGSAGSIGDLLAIVV